MKVEVNARTIKLCNRRVSVGKSLNDSGLFYVRFRKLLSPEKRMSMEWGGLVFETSFSLTREAFGALAQLVVEQLSDEVGSNA